MSQRKERKFRKQAREVAEELLPLVLRPRPRWLPRWAWRAGWGIYFRIPLPKKNFDDTITNDSENES